VSGCHTGGSPPQGLNLEADQSYGLLVDVPSNEVASVDRVEPGEPDNSYLIRKLEGTASVGARMPGDGPPYLTREQMDIIRQWISDGATDDRTLSVQRVADAPARVVAVNPQPEATLDRAPAWVSLALERPVDASLVSQRTVRVAAVPDNGDPPAEDADVVESIHVSPDNPRLIKVDLRRSALDPGRYRIELSDNNGIAVATTDGVPVDGDGDGEPGGDFVSEFTVEQ
jgi:hypothetical protein